MKYLSKYKLFLEQNDGDPPKKQKLEWNAEPSTWDVEKENSSTGDASQSGSGGSTSGSTSSGNKEGQATKKDLGTLWKSVLELGNLINGAFDPKNKNYYFHHHARSATKSLGLSLLPVVPKLSYGRYPFDDVEGAKKSFFGDNIYDTTSWWYRNITKKIIDLIDAGAVWNIGKKISELKNNPDINTEQKNALDVCGDLVGSKIYLELKKSFLRRDNLWEYYKNSFNISVTPDFGISDNEVAISGLTYSVVTEIKGKEDIHTAVDAIKKLVNDLTPSDNSLFVVLLSILDLVDKLFKAEDVWERYKSYVGDDEFSAKKFLNNLFNELIDDVIDPYIKKLDVLNINNEIKKHYVNEATRIKNNFFKSILNTLVRYQWFDPRAAINQVINKPLGVGFKVEFRIQNFNKTSQKTVRINTDF